MSRLRYSLFAGMLLLAGTALAADPLESSRAAVVQARSRVDALRHQQAQLQAQLDVLGTRIEALKSQGKGRLLPGGELDASLKRSQELSGSLTGLASELERASGELERANLALLSALSGEVARLRGAWERSGREQKAALLSRMRALRAEREGLRGALPAAQVPALLPSPTSDDPADLLEQADALRDAGDKVRKQLQALDARIAELREDRELDRRMEAFVEEGQVFDEPDRRLRLDLTPQLHEPSGGSGFGANNTPGLMSSPGSAGSAGSAGGPGSTDTRGPAVSRPPTQPEGRPPDGSGDDLKALEAQRAQLQGLAKELEQKAAQAEARARALK